MSPNGLARAAIGYGEACLQSSRCMAFGRPLCVRENALFLAPGNIPITRSLPMAVRCLAEVKMIQFWWEAFPDSNIGIRTGKESGIIVVDVDGPPERQHWLTALGDLPETWHSTTGKRASLLLSLSRFWVRNRAGFLPQVDIRGDGGYVVAPPSRHSNGTTYEWVVPPTGLPAELPEALLTY